GEGAVAPESAHLRPQRSFVGVERRQVLLGQQHFARRMTWRRDVQTRNDSPVRLALHPGNRYCDAVDRRILGNAVRLDLVFHHWGTPSMGCDRDRGRTPRAHVLRLTSPPILASRHLAKPRRRVETRSTWRRA